MSESRSDTDVYRAVSLVLEMVVVAEEQLELEVKQTRGRYGCEFEGPESLFGKHSIYGRPLGGLDWNFEFSLRHEECETRFLFELSADHNSESVEVRGALSYDGTYGYEVFRETIRIVPSLPELKTTALAVIADMFSQIEIDFAESRRLALAAPRKGQVRD